MTNKILPELNDEEVRALAARPTPQPMAGRWMLTAPDGRAWFGDGPLKCVTNEVNSRIPPDVALARIRTAMMDDEPEPFSLVEHIRRQIAFSEKTCGPGARTKGIIDHITKELKEIADNPLDLEEWIDVIILGLDGAWRCGGTPEAIVDTLVHKQTKNEGRDWPDWRTVPEGQAVEHVRAPSEAELEARRREAFDTLPDDYEVN